MTIHLAQPERRMHKRFRVKSNVFAFLEGKPAMVLDVSEAGAGLSYINEENSGKRFQRLDVVSNNDNCYLRKLPIEVVSDNPLATERSSQSDGCRRCGVKLNNLSLTQRTLWGFFIDVYAIKDE